VSSLSKIKKLKVSFFVLLCREFAAFFEACIHFLLSPHEEAWRRGFSGVSGLSRGCVTMLSLPEGSSSRIGDWQACPGVSEVLLEEPSRELALAKEGFDLLCRQFLQAGEGPELLGLARAQGFLLYSGPFEGSLHPGPLSKCKNLYMENF